MSTLGEIKDQTKYNNVAATTVVNHKVVIPTGEVWEIKKFFGNAGYDKKTIVMLVWKFQKIMAQREHLVITHGDFIDEDIPALTGDGTDELAIVLRNDTAASVRMRGRYIAEVIEVP